MYLNTLFLNVLDFVSQPWHWAVAGTGISLVFIALALLGRHFGVSSTFEQLCAVAGAGRLSDYFRSIDLPSNKWRIFFLSGAVLGGYIGSHLIPSPEPVAISASTVAELESIGVPYPESDALGLGMMPTSISNFTTTGGVVLALLGGFLIGFGARYGRGCTSGHAITGLAHLNLSSLLTVIGFFIGGLLMTHLFFAPLLRLLF